MGSEMCIRDSPTTARLAIMNGAKFVVSPSFDKEVAKMCNIYNIPYMPGCVTPAEMLEAYKYGVDIIKLFPGSLTAVSYTHLRAHETSLHLVCRLLLEKKKKKKK